MPVTCPTRKAGVLWKQPYQRRVNLRVRMRLCQFIRDSREYVSLGHVKHAPAL